MWAAARGRPLSTIAGRPALIAHAANSPSSAAAAVAAGAGWVEVDIWGRRGAVEVRHERRFPLLPLLFEKWYLRLPTRGHDPLAEICAALTAGSGIFLDIKDRSTESRTGVRRLLESAAGHRVAASSQLWPALRDIGADNPGVDLFYSVDSQAKLDLLVSITRRDQQVVGVSARASLLQEATVRALHDCGLQVVAWTVDDPDRAAELARWGVDGITTHVPGRIREALDA